MYTEPLFLTFLIVCTGGLFISNRKRSRTTIAAGLSALFIISWPPGVFLLAQPLEAWYDATLPVRTDAQAIAVLSTAVQPPGPGMPRQTAGPGTYYRTIHSVGVYHSFKPLPILVCGGYPGPPYTESFARTMQAILQQAGVPSSDIWLEEHSSSTYENALYAAEILRMKRIDTVILVTDAFHMLRAERCFRKQNINVIPAPLGFRHLSFQLDEMLPGWRGIRNTEQILHEGLGLLWYWLKGRV